MRQLLRAPSHASLELHVAIVVGPHSGWLVHVVPGRIIEGGRVKALCGMKPGEHSDGWTYPGGEITCRRCKELLERIPEGKQP